MRFRLRYLHHDLELSEGTFTVGRNASCQLAIDDPLVSRRHVSFHVVGETVTVEDLGSRNGVLVNGARIEGKVTLNVDDRVGVGSQELVLLRGKDAPALDPNFAKLTLPNLAVNLASLGYGPIPDADPEPSVVRRIDQFKLLSEVANKALAMGRAAEAERLLASTLGEVIESSRSGRSLPSTLVDQAAKYSAKLATATGKGGWADYVIELYAEQKRMCPAHVIDELYKALRKVTSVDLNRLRVYVAMLREGLPRYSPADRFLFQRIEGLERLALLR